MFIIVCNNGHLSVCPSVVFNTHKYPVKNNSIASIFFKSMFYRKFVLWSHKTNFLGTRKCHKNWGSPFKKSIYFSKIFIKNYFGIFSISVTGPILEPQVNGPEQEIGHYINLVKIHSGSRLETILACWPNRPLTMFFILTDFGVIFQTKTVIIIHFYL